MAKQGSFHRSVTLQAFTVLSVVAALVAGVHGGDRCPPFSCGHLQDVGPPFRRPGDPPECGVEAYQLVCSSSKAIIHINKGTYFVTKINYTDSSFWVVDPNFDMNNTCPLPQWNQLPYLYEGDCTISDKSPPFCNLQLGLHGYWACFVNCSRAITNNSLYKPIACLSAHNSHVYVWSDRYCWYGHLARSCGYLAMIPLVYNGHSFAWVETRNASSADIVEVIRKGFSVEFPIWMEYPSSLSLTIKECLNSSRSYFKTNISDASIMNLTRAFFWREIYFLECVTHEFYTTKFILIVAALASAIDTLKFLFVSTVLCRFVLAPLTVLIFLTYKYCKTRITIDAVEKFLRLQQMIGPTRYGYTDIIAITCHFRDKLGQGGYGSVYKGVLHPGDVHVAVKMLAGNSNCNGEDFISEVSTIGRIHHVNVVRLMGFCSEEMRRALVYEYMPQGSLDKYIFSAEKSFSWDKLNDIALGIARGINYLHQGCEMQILHFDIKPHNILLDRNFIPKVADFGLAKLYPRDNSFVPLSALRGTVGYIAPEMISRSFGVISSKSDVYSFGMLLLEMAGGRRNADSNAGNSSQQYYPSWVYDRLSEQEVGEISVADDMHELEKKLCVIGLWCIQMKSQDRPTMSEVIEMLEYGAGGLQMPSRPFFCDEEHIHMEDSYHLVSELTAISEEDE